MGNDTGGACVLVESPTDLFGGRAGGDPRPEGFVEAFGADGAQGLDVTPKTTISASFGFNVRHPRVGGQTGERQRERETKRRKRALRLLGEGGIHLPMQCYCGRGCLSKF